MVGGSGDPSGLPANAGGLYTKDVTSSAEVFAWDEAGNTPQLTPHPADFLDTLPLADRPYPWAYSSSNSFMGIEIKVDLAGLVSEVEKLSSKQFMFIKTLPASQKVDWDQHQDDLKQKNKNYVRKRPPKWMVDRGVATNISKPHT